MLAIAAALVLHETRGTTIWFDEWSWALERRGGGASSFLEPHNEHLSLVPVALYKLLFVIVGLDASAPYRAMLVVAQLACAVLLFAYAARRIGPVAALVPTALLLFLGPAWQNLLWPFQVAWCLSLGAGLGALLLLDRRDRLGDGGAAALLGLSLASSGLGVAIAVGLVLELVLTRRRAWILAAPIAVYAVWFLAYRPAGLIRDNVPQAPGFAADAAAGAFGALSGLASARIGEQGDALTWGRPLAVAGVALLVWVLARRRVTPPRVLALLAMAVSFWVLTGLRRTDPEESRYLYAGGLFVLLIAVELARDAALSTRVTGALAVVALVIVVANVGDLRDAARFLRAQGAITRADLGALELAQPPAGPRYVLTRLPGYPLLTVEASEYDAMRRAIGSPADSPAALAAAPEAARAEADAELASIHAVAPRPSEPDPPLGDRPAVDAPAPALRETRSCVQLRPPPAGTAPELRLRVPAAGLLIAAGDAPVDVGVRRFAASFPAQPQGTVAAGGSATLRIGGDRARVPWHVRLVSRAAVRACSLRSAP